MSKALAVLKLFFSLVSINSTAKPSLTNTSHFNSTVNLTQATQSSPILLKPMGQVSTFVGQAFHFKVPDDMFYPTFSVGQQDNLKLSLLTVSGGKIPRHSWLRFDENTRTVSAFPLAGNQGLFHYHIKAWNTEEQFATELLRIDVLKNEGQYNHEFVLKTKFNIGKYISNVLARFDFISRVAKYAVDDDVSAVWMKRFDKQLNEITLSFNTIKYSPCDKNLLLNLKNKLATKSGSINPSFAEALSERFPLSGVTLDLIGPCLPPKKPEDAAFEWGILKQLMPILMLMFVVGLPVGIAVAVNRSSKRRKLRLKDQLMRIRREEKKMELAFHTVSNNTRHPSLLSVTDNSNEEEIAESERSTPSNSKMNPTPNGNVSSPVNLGNSVPNSTGLNHHNNNKHNVQPIAVNHENAKTKEQSRIVYMGKSDMNIPVFFTKPKEVVTKDTEMSLSGIAESVSTAIKGFGKSMLNIAGQVEEENINNDDKSNNVSKVQEPGKKLLLLDAELQIPLAEGAKLEDSQQIQTVKTFEPASVNLGGISRKRSKSELRLSEYAHTSQDKEEYDMFSSSTNISGTLMSSGNARLPQRRVSMPYIHLHSQNDGNSVRDHNSQLVNQQTQGLQVPPLKSCLKNSLSEISTASASNQSLQVMGGGFGELTQQSEIPTAAASNQRLPVMGGGLGELTQQIEQMSREAREEFGSRNEFLQSEGHLDSNTLEAYTGKHQMQGEVFDDEGEELLVEDIEAMDYTTWRLRQIKKEEKAAARRKSAEEIHGGIENVEYRHDAEYGVAYEDYTNPYHYGENSCPPTRSQSTYFAGHSSDYNWSEDYEKENRFKQQPPSSPLYSPSGRSLPSLTSTGPAYGSKVDNRSNKNPDDTSIIGKLFSRDKPEENKNLNQLEGTEDSSLVGFLKTRVGGLLGPSEGSSWFK